MVRFLFHILFFLVLLGVEPAPADEPNALEVHFFFSKSCPHCHEQMGLMQAIADNNRDVTIHFHDISESPGIWRKFLGDHDVRFTGVPRTFVAETTFVGYSSTGVALEYSEVYQGYLGNRVQIVKAIEKELGHRLSLGEFLVPEEAGKPGGRYFWPVLLPLFYGLSYVPLRHRLAPGNKKRLWLSGLAASLILSTFLLLGVLPDETVQAYAKRLPYPLFVFVIALADGFNPCAFTVLVILLSLLTYTRRRKDMILLGGVFIATSAVMYFVFIMILVLVGGFFLDRYGKVIILILGALITAAGLLNIKDFFFLNRGISLSLSEEQKLRFTRKASGIVKGLGTPGGRLWLAVGGTIMLGVFVNLVELGCTAILPAVYLTTLVSRYDGVAMYGAWTAFYAVVYILPLLAILVNFIYVFKSTRLSEEQGRLLKLIAGAFMLFFGLLMIFKPDMLAFG